MGGIDYDPLNDWCDACGAAPTEVCRPGCLGKAKADDEAAEAAESP